MSFLFARKPKRLQSISVDAETITNLESIALSNVGGLAEHLRGLTTNVLSQDIGQIFAFVGPKGSGKTLAVKYCGKQFIERKAIALRIRGPDLKSVLGAELAGTELSQLDFMRAFLVGVISAIRDCDSAQRCDRIDYSEDSKVYRKETIEVIKGITKPLLEKRTLSSLNSVDEMIVAFNDLLNQIVVRTNAEGMMICVDQIEEILQEISRLLPIIWSNKTGRPMPGPLQQEKQGDTASALTAFLYEEKQRAPRRCLIGVTYLPIIAEQIEDKIKAILKPVPKFDYFNLTEQKYMIADRSVLKDLVSTLVRGTTFDEDSLALIFWLQGQATPREYIANYLNQLIDIMNGRGVRSVDTNLVRGCFSQEIDRRLKVAIEEGSLWQEGTQRNSFALRTVMVGAITKSIGTAQEDLKLQNIEYVPNPSIGDVNLQNLLTCEFSSASRKVGLYLTADRTFSQIRDDLEAISRIDGRMEYAVLSCLENDSEYSRTTAFAAGKPVRILDIGQDEKLRNLILFVYSPQFESLPGSVRRFFCMDVLRMILGTMGRRV